MSAPVTVNVRDITGCPFAVSAEDGQRLHERIAPLLAAADSVALSFAGIDVLSGAFLAASISPFCADHSEVDLDRLLTVRDISANNRETVKRIFVNVRRYYANPAAYDAAWAEEMGWPSTDKSLQPCENGERQC
jgi:hypothetical protein